MKKLFLILAFISFLSASSQTVNDIPISDIDAEYIQILGTHKAFSRKLTISLDFGQKVKDFGSGKELQLKDENGDKLIFNSMIDALNYMSKHGFEFVQAYAISVGGQNVYHYLLRRKTE
ncbi:MAG: hypothetical protein CMO82_11185 [Winogradskyella sp.]|nr:hypothetical protein [Winogradskyella sp.]|tara:strand:- start:639 stop:995 length:357 start_codon:yes stop_codon:yes gene_type:complete